MALMYPRTLFEPDLKSKAEGKVFDALEERLDDEWEVFHSMGWVVRDKGKGSDDGEIDFVIAHPEQGLLCLEVKGGGIECQHGEWYGIHDGKRERIKDPFQQAIDHRYDLRRKLGGMPAKGGGELADRPRASRFPDITVHELALAPDAPPELIIDRNDMETIDEAVERAFAFHRRRRRAGRPGRERDEEAARAPRPDVRIEVPMAAKFLDEEEALDHPHPRPGAPARQRYGRDKRMVVTGPAGSGKTMLAVERAKRLAATARTCSSSASTSALRDHLRKTEKDSGVYFNTFHGLCVALAKKAEIDALGRRRRRLRRRPTSTRSCRWRCSSAIEELGPQYDALFVDEAQDLHNDWLDALMTTLRDPDDALVWLFMDDNQRVYENQLEVPDEFRPFDLVVNCRNTQAIHREVMKKYEGEVEPEAIGPEGREVELHLTDDQPGTVASRSSSASASRRRSPPGHRRPQLPQHREVRRSRQAGCGKYDVRRRAEAARRLHPLRARSAASRASSHRS